MQWKSQIDLFSPPGKAPFEARLQQQPTVTSATAACIQFRSINQFQISGFQSCISSGLKTFPDQTLVLTGSSICVHIYDLSQTGNWLHSYFWLLTMTRCLEFGAQAFLCDVKWRPLSKWILQEFSKFPVNVLKWYIQMSRFVRKYNLVSSLLLDTFQLRYFKGVQKQLSHITKNSAHGFHKLIMMCNQKKSNFWKYCLSLLSRADKPYMGIRAMKITNKQIKYV